VLRGTLVAQPGPCLLKVDVRWPVRKDIFEGFTLRLTEKHKSSRVVRVDLEQNLIELAEPLGRIAPGSFIELTSGEEVPVLAARFLTHTAIGHSFPPIEMRLGSTRGTNAILEMKGARTALLVTQGFKDILLIGNQQRPDLFALNIRKPPPLYEKVVEITERIAADGAILRALSDAEINSVIRQLRKHKIESIAIAFLNAYKNPQHEQRFASALRKAGFRFVSVSHELSSQIRLLTRAETTVANAYLDPIIHTYVSGIKDRLRNAQLFIMTSSGSLVRAESFYPKDSLLSGPAGGVVGAAHQAIKSGVKHLLAFDMGGTSTDVSMYNGRYDYRFESKVGSQSILSPSLAIETIAAGGGSICEFDGHRLLVGPQSAGANPGPACYGAGGPLTITDVNLLLGRIDPGQFAIPLQTKAAREALQRLMHRIHKTTGRKAKELDVLSSLLQIANEKMSEAIRKISVQQGHNPADFALLSFGGAGGQHACALADILRMEEVLIPYDAGLLSAYGIGQAVVERFSEKLLWKPWDEVKDILDQELESLYLKAHHELEAEGYPSGAIRRSRNFLYLRFSGQDSPIEIAYRPGQSVDKLFRQRYTSIYGHWTDRQLEVESLRVIASVGRNPVYLRQQPIRTYRPRAIHRMKTFCAGRLLPCAVYRWEEMRPGAAISGPALVVSGNSTSFVDFGWRWKLEPSGNARMTRISRHKQWISRGAPKEGELELFTNRFTAVAQEMGALLQRTSFSVNIKERLDFSCALLDASGFLVVNAPHIPVHLGSLGVCVREVRKVISMKDGDVILTNHPAFGGSHLPDVTLIKPVFHKGRLVGYVANRAHHAEIGGSKPGSMPAGATQLDEEGVIISPMHIVRRGKPQWDKVRHVLTTAKYPTRSLDENLADLNGALASISIGEQGLLALCEAYGKKTVSHYMLALRHYARQSLERKINGMPLKVLRAKEYLDDGSPLVVSIQRKGSRLLIDFSNSSAVHPGNLNATKAIVQSVILYTLRLLVNESLPMNEGLMDPIDIVLPEGLLNPDFSKEPMPAVVGGNTEVSQRLTDTLLKAFGLAACSQGTMNNFLFGNDRFGYYETICGGTGAGPGFDGADAVHQHMTNTRITDPEVLEHRYPVRLVRFEIRKGSGGNGRWSGGHGAIREFEFLESLEVNLLSQHRVEKPYGISGGLPGLVGRQQVVHPDGSVVALRGIVNLHAEAGARIAIETPGGGGFGKGARKKSSKKRRTAH
jgi:5-oxoprolinase (ATP-hydrolysing)